MGFSETLFLILTLSSLLFVNGAAAAAASPQASDRNTRIRVTRLCRVTANSSLCVLTILPRIHGTFNPYKALKAEILATQSQVKKTAAVIASLAAKPSNSKRLNDSYVICGQQYESMLDSIDRSLKAVAQRNVIEASFMLSAVLSYWSGCEDAFEGRTPFAGDSNDVFQLGGNCLDIMKAMKDGVIHRNLNGVSKSILLTSPLDTIKIK